MTKVYCGPVRDIDRIAGRLHNMFDDCLDAFAPGRTESFSPRVDLYEDEKNVYLEVELPGISKSDVKVAIHDGVLTIEGERKFEQKREGTFYHQRETRYGTFSRSFNLSSVADMNSAEASFKDGLLRVELPIKSAKQRERSIKIS